IPIRYLGAEYMSRSHRGDPGASQPLVPVSRAEEYRAFSLLDRYFFSDDAFHFSQSTLNRTAYSEFTALKASSWIYQPGRHDLPVAEIIGQGLGFALDFTFSPNNLGRIDEMALRARPGETMSITDLFDWMQTSVYGDLSAHRMTVPLLHRNLQRAYAH